MTASPATRWRPGFDRKAPKVWDPEKAQRISTYPKTPEAYEAMRAAARDRMARLNAEGRATRRGVPDGWSGRKEERAVCRDRAARVADAAVDALKVRGDLDGEDPRVEEALRYVASVIVDAGCATSDKLAAARILLAFLQPRPTTHHAATVADAETLLADLLGRV